MRIQFLGPIIALMLQIKKNRIMEIDRRTIFLGRAH